jgi:hypothetical protein
LQVLDQNTNVTRVSFFFVAMCKLALLLEIAAALLLENLNVATCDTLNFNRGAD